MPGNFAELGKGIRVVTKAPGNKPFDARSWVAINVTTTGTELIPRFNIPLAMQPKGRISKSRDNYLIALRKKEVRKSIPRAERARQRREARQPQPQLVVQF